MSKHTERTRVRRLISGQINPEDLSRLIMYLRDHNGGSYVKEVSNFIAHRGRRTQGVITEHVRDWSVKAQAIYKFHSKPPYALDPDHVPSIVPDFLQAALNNPSSETKKRIKNQTGHGIPQAKKIVDSFVSGLVRNTDGSYRIVQCEKKELDLLLNLLRTIHVGPAFTSKDVFNDLRSGLIGNGILDRADVPSFNKLEKYVAILALSEMCNRWVVQRDGTAVYLCGGLHQNDIAVFSPSVFDGDPLFDVIQISAPVFIAHVDPHEICSDELIDAEGSWEFEIEVGSDWKLRPAL